MQVKPIPKSLLKSSVVYKPFIQEGREGGIWGDEIVLDYVCVDVKSAYSLDGVDQSVACKAVVYYDCFNSLPLGIGFRERDILIYNDQELVVESVVKPNWNAAGDHHYELRCT